ncbi:DJ-1/PfpI family protein [Saccharobesus litoralis]|nr:DJ-1/PfpI family protein [Saccharobesus litoralis]
MDALNNEFINAIQTELTYNANKNIEPLVDDNLELAIKTVTLVLFDDVEVLDFAGPYEVFSLTRQLNNNKLFKVQTASLCGDSVVAKNGLSISPDVALDEVQTTDLLLIPGGDGVKQVLKNKRLLRQIERLATEAQYVLSVCTGAVVLAKLGILKHRQATTHHQAFEWLAEIDPSCQVLTGSRFVDTGDVITCGGTSAGIDMSLYMIEKLTSREIRKATQGYMEYQN